MLEFALVISFAMPLLLYTFELGMALSRSIQVRTVNRDAGAMFVRNIDFSLPGNRQMLVRLARGLGIQDGGGDGVVILSQVMYVGDNECLAGGFAPGSGSCPNYEQYVFVKRYLLGDSSLRSSSLGTPSGNLIASDGTIGSRNYLTDPSCVAANFGGILTLSPGEVSYISETFRANTGFSMPGLSGGTYTRNFF
jgi:hypothetical protein